VERTAEELPVEMTLHVGEERPLRLPSLGGGGYRWQPEVLDGAEAVEVSRRHVREHSQPATTFSDEEVAIRGRTAGSARVRLVQRRPWETGAAPVREHVVDVRVVP
jgi:predicted secreted protein